MHICCYKFNQTMCNYSADNRLINYPVPVKSTVNHSILVDLIVKSDVQGIRDLLLYNKLASLVSIRKIFEEIKLLNLINKSRKYKIIFDILLEHLGNDYKLTPGFVKIISCMDNIDTRSCYISHDYYLYDVTLQNRGHYSVPPGGIYSCFYFKYGVYYLTRYLVHQSNIILPMFINKLLKYISRRCKRDIPAIVIDIFLLIFNKGYKLDSKTKPIMDVLWDKYMNVLLLDLVPDTRNMIIGVIINIV